jgi:hypothetical protein
MQAILMLATLALLAAAADPAPRAIQGALGLQLGAVAAEADLGRLGFPGPPEALLRERATGGRFPVSRVGRSPSGHVVVIVLERRWADAAGHGACRDEQAGLAQALGAAFPTLVRQETGPEDIRFVTLYEPGERWNARTIAIICSHIPGSVPPTLRVVWRVSPAERQALYPASPAPASE